MVSNVDIALRKEIYGWLTERAVVTLTALAKESHGQLSEDNQSHWDMAQGALRLWSDSVGSWALEDDRAALEAIIAGMGRAAPDAV